jgi:hypothetical protein
MACLLQLLPGDGLVAEPQDPKTPRNSGLDRTVSVVPNPQVRGAQAT